MSFGGSGNDSSTGPSQQTTTTTNNDNRMVTDGGSTALNLAGASGNHVSLVQTDHGAVAGAFDFAKGLGNDAFGFARSVDNNNSNNFSHLLDGMQSQQKLQSDTLSSLLGGISSQQNFVASTQASAKGTIDNKTIMILGIAIAAVIAVGFYRAYK